MTKIRPKSPKNKIFPHGAQKTKTQANMGERWKEAEISASVLDSFRERRLSSRRFSCGRLVTISSGQLSYPLVFPECAEPVLAMYIPANTTAMPAISAYDNFSEKINNA